MVTLLMTGRGAVVPSERAMAAHWRLWPAAWRRARGLGSEAEDLDEALRRGR